MDLQLVLKSVEANYSITCIYCSVHELLSSVQGLRTKQEHEAVVVHGAGCKLAGMSLHETSHILYIFVES